VLVAQTAYHALVGLVVVDVFQRGVLLQKSADSAGELALVAASCEVNGAEIACLRELRRRKRCDCFGSAQGVVCGCFQFGDGGDVSGERLGDLLLLLAGELQQLADADGLAGGGVHGGNARGELALNYLEHAYLAYERVGYGLEHERLERLVLVVIEGHAVERLEFSLVGGGEHGNHRVEQHINTGERVVGAAYERSYSAACNAVVDTLHEFVVGEVLAAEEFLHEFLVGLSDRLSH